jgi:hypothetical protein
LIIEQSCRRNFEPRVFGICAVVMSGETPNGRASRDFLRKVLSAKGYCLAARLTPALAKVHQGCGNSEQDALLRLVHRSWMDAQGYPDTQKLRMKEFLRSAVVSFAEAGILDAWVRLFELDSCADFVAFVAAPDPVEHFRF